MLLVSSDLERRRAHLLKQVGWHLTYIEEGHASGKKQLTSVEVRALLFMWKMTAYSKILFIDVFSVVEHDPSILFEFPQLSALPADGGRPERFGVEVLVIEPDALTYRNLLSGALSMNYCDVQCVLNHFFCGSWF